MSCVHGVFHSITEVAITNVPSIDSNRIIGQEFCTASKTSFKNIMCPLFNKLVSVYGGSGCTEGEGKWFAPDSGNYPVI